MLYIVKFVLSAVIIVAITEVVKVKQLGHLAGLIAALPIVSILAMTWMYIEQRDKDVVAKFSTDVFWFVLPTLPFFLLMPVLLKQMHFAAAMAAGVLVTFACFGFTAWVLGQFGVKLI